MKYVNTDVLWKINACRPEMQEFMVIWPGGEAEVTSENLKKAINADLDVVALVERLHRYCYTKRLLNGDFADVSDMFFNEYRREGHYHRNRCTDLKWVYNEGLLDRELYLDGLDLSWRTLVDSLEPVIYKFLLAVPENLL